MNHDFEDRAIWKKSLGPEGPNTKAAKHLRDEFFNFREKAKKLGNEIKNDFPNFSHHDISHSDSLWRLADLVHSRSDDLSPAEAFVLGGAFLVHDLGMCLAAYPEPEKIRESKKWKDYLYRIIKQKLGRIPDEIELTNATQEEMDEADQFYLREKHAERADELLDIYWPSSSTHEDGYLIGDKEIRNSYGALIGRIASSHCWHLERLEEEFQEISGETGRINGVGQVDELYLACLLRIADILHMDSSRVELIDNYPPETSEESIFHLLSQGKLNKAFIKDELIQFTGAAFEEEYFNAWWQAYDLINNADDELRNVNHLLQVRRQIKLKALGVYGARDPKRLRSRLPTKNWHPVDASMKVSDIASLINKLGGRELYGDDNGVPIRELLQNASDAILARVSNDDMSLDAGGINIKFGLDDMGTKWIEIADNGIGMSEAVLTGPFLDFGKTYWDSDLMLNELPGLITKGFEPTGQFGIGFFSVFMIGERVKVVTLRAGEAREKTKVLEFNGGVKARPLLRPAKTNEILKEPGTSVRIWLDKVDSYREEYKFLLEPHRFIDFIRDLCPAFEAEVNLITLDNKKIELLKGGALEGQKPKDLINRMGLNIGDRLSKDDTLLYTNFLKNIMPLTDENNNQIVGRACILPSNLAPMVNTPNDQIVHGIVSVGGFRTRELNGIAGYLKGRPVSAVRNNSEPIVSKTELARWATEQADLSLRVTNRPDLLVEVAKIVKACGGKTGDLPICKVPNGGWLTSNNIASWETIPNEIIVTLTGAIAVFRSSIDEFYLYDNVLIVDPATPQIVKGFIPGEGTKWPYNLFMKKGPPYTWDLITATLLQEIIEALAIRWKSTYEDIIKVSSISVGNRDIGKIVGPPEKPLKGHGDTLRNPHTLR